MITGVDPITTATYIWQRPDWTQRLRWDLARCLPALTAARLSEGRLLGKAESIGFDLGSQLQATALVDEAMTTAAIEGERLDRDSVRSSVARHLSTSTANLPPPQRHIDGLVEMLLDATTCAEQPLTAERLMGWHAALFPSGFSGIRRIAVGSWRTGSEPMLVVSGRHDRRTIHFEAPSSGSVPVEMERFLHWWAAGEPADSILRAGLAHLWFVTIHPFDDGNGRVARALADMALMQDEGTTARLWSLSVQIQEERRQYYSELEAAQRGAGDITAWLSWFAGCVGRAIQRAEGALDRVLVKARFWQRHQDVSLNPRQRKVLNRMLDEEGGFVGGMNTRKYVALTRISPATAQRDLADLLDKGLLIKREGGGRSTSYALWWPVPTQDQGQRLR